MGQFARLITMFLILLMPVSASAQFVPANQAKQQASLESQRELDSVLSDISDKGATARRKVRAILADAAAKKIGASAAQRKIDTIIGDLKSDLNGIVNGYAKKNPAGPEVRAAYSAAQDSLNSLRREASGTLDDIGFENSQNKNQLSGKYLEYQEKIKELTTQGLTEADERLAERGTKDTVKKDLEKIIQSTQEKVAIATTVFLTANPDVLPSAIERVKKTELDAFSKAMATRFKTADGRGNDKALDLTEEEQAAVLAFKKEVSGLVDRAISTAQGIVSGVASANLPTSSNVPGVNPLLEAKFKAQKQVKEIRQGTQDRVDRQLERFMKREDMSALAKEVAEREAKRDKARLNDTTKELELYFTAGDPNKKKYQNRKEDLQDQAEGCSSFLCDLGRVASAAAGGLISKATGGAVQIPGQAISNLVGIREGDPYAFRGAYSGGASVANINGRYYATGAYGNQRVPYDPRCYGAAEIRQNLAQQLLGVEVAQAQQESDTEKNTTEASGGTYPNGGQQTGGVGDESDPNFVGPPRPTNSTSSSSSKSSGGFGGFLKDAFSDKNFTRYLGQATSSIFNRNTGPGGTPCFFPTQTTYGGGSYYQQNSPFGAYPVGQYLGYQTNYLRPNLTADRYAYELSQGFGFLASTDQQYGRTYQEVSRILASGQLTYDGLARVSQLLQSTDFYRVNGGSQGTIPNMLANLCAQVLSGGGGNNLISFCRTKFVPAAATTTTRPASTRTSVPTPSAGSTSAAQQLTGRVDSLIGHFNTIEQRADCRNADVAGVIQTELTKAQTQLADMYRRAASDAYIDYNSRIEQTLSRIIAFRNNCPGGTTSSSASTGSDLLAPEPISTQGFGQFVDDTRANPPQ